MSFNQQIFSITNQFGFSNPKLRPFEDGAVVKTAREALVAGGSLGSCKSTVHIINKTNIVSFFFH